MKDPRAVATHYMELLCAQKFSEAFDLLSDDCDYRIIGNTPLSAPMKGRAAVKAALVPALASFQKAPKLTLKEVIVDGNRAVGLASGHGVGPTGLPYNQAHYAMVLRIDNGRVVDVVEFADTVEVEIAIGNKLVPA